MTNSGAIDEPRVGLVGDAPAIFTPAAEAVYRALVRRGALSPEDLACAADRDADEVKASIMLLEELELAEWLDGKAVPRPPYPAMEAIANRRAREAARARELAQSFSDLWSQHTRGATYLEIIQAEEACESAQSALTDGALEEVCALSIGPVGDASTRPPPKVVDGFFESIARGVRYQAVYSGTVLRDAAGLAAVRSCIEAGEQARVCPDVPVNLTIADRRLALLSVPGCADRRRDMIIVRPSGLLDVLIAIFESYWRIATPLTAEPVILDGDVPYDAWRDLLSLLAAGLTDDAIARELGVSERTVGRRVARLEEILGAASRFQLGLQAARHGWL